jgi:hypothetical protein
MYPFLEGLYIPTIHFGGRLQNSQKSCRAESTKNSFKVERTHAPPRGITRKVAIESCLLERDSKEVHPNTHLEELVVG